ncbi:MAG: hypothetical protein H0V76_09670 [Blastocatellia bacterium]|nr:hypothetical protein [Blastocatellia bacterium]
MKLGNENAFSCGEFEETLSEYLDKTLDMNTRKVAAAHALKCPVCHSLMNDVKQAIAACHQLAEPRAALTRLEAQIIQNTLPEALIDCEAFEAHLTDYLDGFLTANVFHRWERHATLCDDCTDLPGMVVRSMAAVVSYKLDELPLPAGLHERILIQTIGSEDTYGSRQSWGSRFGEWVRGIRIPISVPQLAPVAAMSMFAFLVVSQGVSADGTLTDVYNKSYQLAETTYRQSTDALKGIPVNGTPNSEVQR